MDPDGADPLAALATEAKRLHAEYFLDLTPRERERVISKILAFLTGLQHEMTEEKDFKTWDEREG